MYAVLAALCAAASVLLVEGSIVFYRTPAAPDWLRGRRLLQVCVSGLFSIGIMIAIVFFMHFLVDYKNQGFGTVEGGVMAATLLGSMYGWRRIKAVAETYPPSDEILAEDLDLSLYTPAARATRPAAKA